LDDEDFVWCECGGLPGCGSRGRPEGIREWRRKEASQRGSGKNKNETIGRTFKQRRRGSGWGDGEMGHNELLQDSWVILRNLQSRFQSKCVSEPREALAKHDSAKLARPKEKAEHRIRLSMGRVVEYQKHSNIDVCTSVTDLFSLRVEGQPDKALAELLLDQIRVQHHV
jgi:hypothetical protein